MTIRNHIVVGADGSEHANRAVVAAAREAKLRGVPLRVVHAFVWPAIHAPVGVGAADPALREAADRLLQEAKATAEAAVPGLRCETELVTDTSAAALLRASRDAEVLVVGDRGLGGFSSLLVGSTAIQLSMHANCPVMVIRGAQPASDARIVVGVDASDHAQAALAFAFEEAAFRGVEVHAVHAWTVPLSTGPGDMLPLVYDPDQLREEETRLTAELLAGWGAKYPDVRLTHELVHAPASQALIAASDGAGLVVVGARGMGGFRGLLFGSVSQAVLHHAHCPVAVVRPSQHASRS